MNAGVERAAQVRLDRLPEPHRVVCSLMHLVGLRIAPGLNDGEVVGGA